MANDLTSGLAGLALLGGPAGAFASTASLAGAVQTRAARLARAQFTLPVIDPPWRSTRSGLPESVSAIQRLQSIIDKVQSSASLPPDLQSAFTAYKALDRLRVLAEFATRATTSAAERTQLHTSFAKGVAELQRYLAIAPSDQLTLSFGQPRSRLQSLALPAANPVDVSGSAVTKDRYAALPGLSGDERLVVALNRPGASDTLTVDLAQSSQPPTLDSVAQALNAAIAAIPQRDPNGAPVLDENGSVRPRWDTQFAVVKGDEGWGLQLRTAGVEQVSLREEAAQGALMVAAGQSADGAAAGVALTRFDLPDGLLNRNSLGALTAVDRQATAEQALLPARKSPIDGKAAAAAPVSAAVSARAVVSDAQGFSYVVGTSSGDSGVQRGDGADDILLSKVDSRGTILWQRSLGSGGTAEGAALALAPSGDVVVAGTVTGDLDGAETDGDIMVMRFSAAGEERFATAIRSLGADRASAVSVGADGSIVVGGKSANAGAMLARVDASGKLLERLTLGEAGSDIRALASGPDGSTLALLSGSGGTSLARIGTAALTPSTQVALSGFDGSSLAIADDGRVAVGGAVTAGNRNGRVVQLSASLTVTATTDLASAGDDRVDSLAWLGDALFAGGRTSGPLGGPKSGSVDGFVARLGADGGIEQISQWGRSGTAAGPVALSASNGADGAPSALGFRSGTLNPPDSVTLVDRTALRKGDRFSFRVDGGKEQTISITASDTLATLAERMGKLAGRNVAVRTVKDGGSTLLQFEVKAGHSLDLTAGPDGRDALAKLALEPGRLAAPPPVHAKAPRVSPGGIYGLDLTSGLSVRDSALAAASLARLKMAISTTQTAYRSLYWDSNKEALVNGSKGGGNVSAYQSAQLARYQDALARLGGALTSGM